MRRPLAALLLGTLSLAGIAPVAAGAAGLPHIPFMGQKKPVSVPPLRTVDRPDPDPRPAPDRKPDPAPVPRPDRPEPKPAPRPEPRPLPDPVPRPDPRPEPRPLPDPVPTPGPRPEPKPVPTPDPRPVPEPDPRPVPPDVDPMKLACTLHRFDAATDKAELRATFAPAGPVVVCEWARADRRIAGYRLWRAERPDGGRQVIFKTRDATRYADRDVSFGHGYVYAVEAVDASGRVIARSEPVAVKVPAPVRPAA